MLEKVLDTQKAMCLKNIVAKSICDFADDQELVELVQGKATEEQKHQKIKYEVIKINDKGVVREKLVDLEKNEILCK